MEINVLPSPFNLISRMGPYGMELSIHVVWKMVLLYAEKDVDIMILHF